MIPSHSVAHANTRGYNLVVAGLIIIFAGLLFFATSFSPQYSVLHNLLYVIVLILTFPAGTIFICIGLLMMKKADGSSKFDTNEL
jgi:multisubunit Na+/H+ antiporter MnhG subunit